MSGERKLASAARLLISATAVAAFAGSCAVAWVAFGHLPDYPLLEHRYALGGAAALLFWCFLDPSSLLRALPLVALGYLGLFAAPVPLLLAALHLLLLLGGAAGAGRRVARSLPPSSSASERWFLTGFLFLVAGVSLSFLLLAIHAQHRVALLGASALFCAAMARLEPEALPEALADLRRALRPRRRSLLLSFVACTAVLWAFSGLLLMTPISLTGDAEKAYLAFARYFALGNRLVLSDPLATSDWITRSLAHSEEVLLSAGFVLAGNLGARLFALAIVAVKLTAVFALCRGVAGFSRGLSAFLVLSFSLLPIVLELDAVVRPENLLTVAAIALVWFAERALSPAADGSSKVRSTLFLLGASAVSLAIGAKYTGLWLAAAVVLAYGAALLRAARSLGAAGAAGSVLALLVGVFWYLRNLALWGSPVGVTPFGRSHLTIVWPPVRSLHDAWQFLSSGLTETSKFTEYGDLGYGPWGVVLLPALVLALASPRLRRMAIVALVYTALLLASTRQIRYLAPVVPFLLIFAGDGLQKLAARIPRTLAHRAGPRLAFAWIAAQLLLAIAVNSRGVVANGWGQTAALLESGEPLDGRTEPFRTLDALLGPDSRVLSSHVDFNYSVEGSFMRGDPFLSFADLLEKNRSFRITHWFVPSWLVDQPAAVPYFGDPDFLADSSKRLAASSAHGAPLIYLAAPDYQALAGIERAIAAQGWEPQKTQLISSELKRRFPVDILVGDALHAPGLKHPLFRADAILDRGGRDFEREPPPLLAAHFEGGEPPLTPFPDPVVKVDRQGLLRDESSGAWRAVQPGAQVTYALEPGWPDDGALLEAYVRADLGAARLLRFELTDARGTAAFTLSSGEARRKWSYAGGARLHGKAAVTLRLEGTKAALREVRLLFRPPSAPAANLTWLSPSEHLGALVEKPALLEGAVAYLLDASPTSGLETDPASRVQATTTAVKLENVPGVGMALTPETTDRRGSIRYRWRLGEGVRGRPLIARVFVQGRVYAPSDELEIALDTGAGSVRARAPIFTAYATPAPLVATFALPASADSLDLELKLLATAYSNRVLIRSVLVTLTPGQ